MARKLTDVETASEMLGEPVEDGVWFTRFKQRWYHDLSTGTELDLIVVVLLSPVILWYWLFRNNGKTKAETGPVFAVLTDSEIVFFAGNEGIFRRHFTHVSDRRDLNDIKTIACDNSRQSHVRFICTSAPEISLYYSGPRLKLDEFVSRST